MTLHFAENIMHPSPTTQNAAMQVRTVSQQVDNHMCMADECRPKLDNQLLALVLGEQIGLNTK